ncbi:MAG: AAA family ATPase [Deltaproteobacteria bacterium]|jgi:chromosome segregation protein|nr:AAA family ATPase [Deltaproteobacteria bacterium]
MYLKRLEIVGFKSFTERVVVPFSPGISAVVGPNGCGKSNIIDAIRWVMGEQSPRHLRARNMEDILFNGSRGRAPAALAEVTLVLTRDLEPGRSQAEVGVTRRLYRGGDSEYLINKSPCRLKDILRFFMEAGMGTRAYAIIEQEKVGRLVDARPEDRRLLLDEAAGIIRFKEQKKESERKIDSAGQNLTAVAALMAETKQQLGVIARAAAKAAKYQSLKAELKELELVLISRKYLELTGKRQNMAQEVIRRQEELTSLAAVTSEAELAVEALRLEETALEQKLEDELGLYHGLQNSFETFRLEKEHTEETLTAAQGRREKALTELRELEDNRDKKQLERDSLNDSLAKIRAESSAANEKRNLLKEKWLTLKSALESQTAERDAALTNFSSTKDGLQELRETLAGLENLLAFLIDRKKSLELEKNQGDGAIREIRESLAARIRFKDGLQEELKDLEEDIEIKTEDLASARDDLENLTRSQGLLENEAAALSARLETLENLKGGFSWYPAGVKALMNEPSLLEAGLLGPAAEYLEVPEGFEAAAESALGERLAWLLTKNRPAAILALKFARDRRLGRCGFISQADLKTNDLAEELLGDFILADSLEETSDGQCILTRSGEYLSRAFVVGGISSENDDQEGLLARLKEVEAAGQKLSEVKEKLEAERAKTALARENRTRAESALALAQDSRERLIASLAEANSKILVTQSEEKGLVIRLESLAKEVEQVESQYLDNETKREKAALAREELEAQAARLEAVYKAAAEAAAEREDELRVIQEEGQAASLEAETASERLDSTLNSLRAAEEWLDNLENRRGDLFNDAETLGREIELLTEKLQKLDLDVLDLPERLAEAEKKVAELRQLREETRTVVSAKEEAAREARKKREEATKELNVLEKDDLEADYSFNQLADGLLKDWRIVLVDPVQEEQEALLKAPSARTEESQDGEPSAGPVENPEITDDPASGVLMNEEPFTAEFSAEKPPLVGPLVDPDLLPDSSASSSNGSNENVQPDLNPLAEEELPAAETEPDPGSLDRTAENIRPLNIEVKIPTFDESGQTENGESDEDDRWSSETVQAPPEKLDPREWASKELPPGAEETCRKIKDRLLSMGEISLTAIEEEAELNKRYNFHKNHYDDLTQALTDLKNSISRINQTCRELFTRTFKEADAKFREIFPVLFEGGEGWLGLSDENDPLESGVEIHVHPPGKKIMVMSLLSGGEKALTALALIFALYLIKPSPFCLLDEADAPLDEANIDRFNRLLRRLSQASQIIMVTHNKRTMQISDTLYGVTMETPGVSRLVSVNLAEAEGMTDA